MSIEPVLEDLVNLQNETSVVDTINSNNAAIKVAMDKALSRVGQAPNEMEANLDMNSNRILNLPAPVSDHEPARKIDLAGLGGGGGGGVTDHGALSGLLDDDHPQYLNDTRGDARYLQQSNADTRYLQQSNVNETVEDIIGTKVIAGSNVSVSYNDTTGFTTISATPSGGGTGDETGLVDITTTFSIDATGSTDVSSLIQSSINTVSTAGLYVYLKDGVYNVGSASISIPDNATVVLSSNASLVRTLDPLTEAPVVAMGNNSKFIGGQVSNNVVVTSSSSLPVAVGTAVFTLNQSGLSYTVGRRLTAMSNVANCWMQGTVTSISGTTLTLSIDVIGSSGTFANWTISYSGANNAAIKATSKTRVVVEKVRVTSSNLKFAVGIELENTTLSKILNCEVSGIHNRCFYVYQSCSNILIEGCNANGLGLCFYGYNVNPAGVGFCDRIKIVNCDASSLASQGYELGDNTFRSSITGCSAISIGNTGFLIQLANGGYPQYNTLTSCTANSCTNFGFQISDTFYNLLTSCVAISCGTGLFFNGAAQINTVTGFGAYAGTTINGQPGHGIVFNPGTSRNDVQGLSSIANAGYGVVIASGSSLNRVVGRSFNNTSGNISDLGSSSVYDLMDSDPDNRFVQVATLTESVQDIIGSSLVAGSGISISYNDPSNTITISNTGSAGSIPSFLINHQGII